MANRASLFSWASALLFAAAGPSCGRNPNGAVIGSPTSTAEAIAIPVTQVSAEALASQIVREDLEPPWSLTASDGSGLLLSRVDAKAVFEGPLAFTELHLYFHNPEDRVREGTFQITLPQNASVSRFAMETNGQWMEAEVVEKQIARRAYDDALHMRQDPALLEKAAGNQFTAKVFPIAGRADKHIVISYSQELPGGNYVLPLRGLPKTERVDVSLQSMAIGGKREEQKLTQRNWQPDRDFVSTAAAGQALSAGNLVAAQIEIGDAGSVREAPAGVTILVDTSASRALGYTSYIKQVQTVVDNLRTTWGATLPLQVIAYDQDTEVILDGKAYEFGDAQVKKLVERGAAGASDLGQALAWLSQHTPQSRVLVITDGVITAGTEGADLQKQVKALANVKVERIDFALSGGLRDDKAMAALVRDGLQRAGTVLDLDKDPVATAIAETVHLDVKVEIPGAEWVYPKVFPTARAGERATVYARVTQPMQALDVKVNGKAQHVSIQSGTLPLIQRAFAGAEIAEMEETLKLATGKDAAALRTRIAKKSVASRVVSSQTSMLVLESDEDYARYGIDRRSLADIMAIGASGIELRNRHNVVIAQPQIATGDEEKPEKGKDKNEAKKEEIEGGILDGKVADDGDVSLSGSSNGIGAGMAAGSGMPAPAPPPMAMRPAPPRSVSTPRPEPVDAPKEDAPAQAAPQVERRQVAQATATHSAARRDRAGAMDDPFMPDDRASGPSGGGGGGGQEQQWPPPDKPAPLTGEMATIERLAHGKQTDAALERARAWHAKEPGNVLALIALGDALEAKGGLATAARVYGSIIDLYPGRADMRRFAGERLARLTAQSKDLIIDTYRRAVEDRPDHMTGHRLLAYAYERAGRHADAFAAILAGLDQEYRSDSYAGGQRVLGDDASMIGASYAAAEPGKRDEIVKALEKHHLRLATRSSTRFILYWETDANDVDFHIQDSHGGHAFYGSKQLPSGGELYADITTGYGPECFAIPGTPKAGPYRLSIDYYSQGPMGFGMGLLEIQRFDGKGGLSFEDRPYVIMNDHAYVDLGTVK